MHAATVSAIWPKVSLKLQIQKSNAGYVEPLYHMSEPDTLVGN